jgi:hypothetical protein
MRSNIVFVSIDKVRRIAHHESPPFGFGNVLEIVGLIDGNPVTETTAAHCSIAGGDCSRIDVRKAKGLAQPISKYGKSDEARTTAPLKDARLLWHSSPTEKWDEVLTEVDSSAVKFLLVDDFYAAESGASGWAKPPQDRPYDFMFVFF